MAELDTLPSSAKIQIGANVTLKRVKRISIQKKFIHSSVGGLLRYPVVGVVISRTHAPLCSPSSSFGRYGRPHYNVSAPFRSFTTISPKKVKKNVLPPIMSVLDIGGTKISKEDVVKDEPTNNVPDGIFSKLGLQLHMRDQHPLGILKNAIYDYFDKNYSTEFVKFDNLCPIVSVKQGDILFLHMSKDPIRTGEIVVFNVIWKGEGITPYANLYHYDLPEALEKEYKELLSHNVVNDFADYAEFCFKTFRDRVKNWMTFNEPRVVAALGYDNGIFAPGRCSKEFGNYTEGNSATELVMWPIILSYRMQLQFSDTVKNIRSIEL